MKQRSKLRPDLSNCSLSEYLAYVRKRMAALDINDPGRGADFTFAHCNGRTLVKLHHNDVRDFVQESTGARWITIYLQSDDPLLTALFLKFKGRQET